MLVSELNRFTGNPKLLSPISLAFVGDSVFEIMVREQLLSNGSVKSNLLHKRSTGIVNAVSQAKAYDQIKPLLNDDEANILRRGRNSGVSRIPKSCTVEEYHKATGLEALFGYLYLSGNNARIIELFDIILNQAKTEGV